MSSNKPLLLLLALPLALLQAARAQTNQSTGAISCPSSLSVTESAAAPSGWSTEPTTKARALQRISVFQKSSTGQIFDLAPDRTSRQATTVQQQWTVAHDPSLKTYLRCRYRDTDATLVLPLLPEIKACKFKFAADRHGTVTDVLDISCR